MGITQDQIKSIIPDSFNELSKLSKKLFKSVKLFYKFKYDITELSFYGYETNGGFDSDLKQYWMNTLFLKGK